MNKLFCCGITSNEREKITNLIIRTKPYVDGFIWCVDEKSNDGTFEILDANKKDGKILKHYWSNSHDFQANEYLLSGTIKNEDWILICDTSELPTEFWLKRMRYDIDLFEKQKFGALYCSGRPYLVKYWDHMFFLFTPHWSLQGVKDQIYIIPEEEKYLYIENKRDLDKTKHYCIHNTKYLYCYGRSNQTELAYGKYGRQIVDFHENKRFEFRHYARKVLKLDYTLDSLENYFKKSNYTEEFINYVQLEFPMSEFFQVKILGMDFIKEIVPKRYKFSFRDYLKYGNGFSNSNYLGTILRYDSGNFN